MTIWRLTAETVTQNVDTGSYSVQVHIQDIASGKKIARTTYEANTLDELESDVRNGVTKFINKYEAENSLVGQAQSRLDIVAGENPTYFSTT